MTPSILCFAGRSNSGKTTLIERVIPALTRAGYRVATVKHAGHGFELDTEGKDSWRHKQAGASAVVVLSKGSMAMFADTSEEMKQNNPIQWLQNYRRKRWIQIRNLFYAFMLQASEIQQESQNPPPDLISSASVLSKNPNTWAEVYDEVYEAYTNNNWSAYEPPVIKKPAKKSRLKDLSSSMSQLSLEKPQTSKWYITQKQNETITKIAKTFKLDSSVLLKLNQNTYPTIKKSSKLRKNTKIQLRK